MNTSSSSDLFPFECVDDYDPIVDILKYIVTFLYLGFGLFLHLSILKVVLISEKKYYKNISFMQLFVTDSVASSLLLIDDIFFNRIFIYISPLCTIVGPYFWSPSFLMRVVFVLLHHMRFAKSVAQIFLVLNRMSCVLAPLGYNIVWQKYLRLVYFLVAVVPFGGTWNICISQLFMDNIYGGFAVNYSRFVKWAALSLFQSIYILTALGFTVICTSITLWKLMVLSERVKSTEKSLCLSSLFISFTFLIVGGTQMMFAVCSVCRSDFDYILQFLAFDVFTVGSAVVMIISNKPLRDSVFSKRKASPKVVSVNMITVQ